MSALKSLTFTTLPKIGANPTLDRRTNMIARLEEQKVLLKDPNYIRTVRTWAKKDGRLTRSVRRTPATRFANHVTYESGHIQDIVGKIYQETDGRPLQEFRIVQVHGAGVQMASGWAADALHPVLEAPGA